MFHIILIFLDPAQLFLPCDFSTVPAITWIATSSLSGLGAMIFINTARFFEKGRRVSAMNGIFLYGSLTEGLRLIIIAEGRQLAGKQILTASNGCLPWTMPGRPAAGEVHRNAGLPKKYLTVKPSCYARKISWPAGKSGIRSPGPESVKSGVKKTGKQDFFISRKKSSVTKNSSGPQLKLDSIYYGIQGRAGPHGADGFSQI